MRVTSLGLALIPSIALLLGGCSSGAAGATSSDDGGGGLDATKPSGSGDGSVQPGDDDVDGAAADGGAISIQPPIDDADAPTTEAGPGGPWIAFASTRGGDFDIYLVHDDGTALHALVQSPGTDLSPAWSPDGAKVAFESNRGDGGAYQVYVVDVASGVTAALATGLAGSVSPAWSPDGNTIAIGGPNGLYTVPAAGGTATPITTGSFRDNTPAWSPDGMHVYFSSNRESGGAFDVWSVQPDGGGLAQVTTGAGILGGPAISSDGATIAFSQTGTASGAGSATQIAFFTVSTKATTVFSAQSDYEPAFSPDGTKLAMTSTRYDVANPEIVVVGVPGATSPFRLTTSAGVDGQPAFQPGH